MNEFAKMDIFFMITTVAVVVVAISMVVVLVYIARLLHTLNRIATDVEEEAEAIRADLEDARAKVRREGLKLAHLFSFFGKTTKRLSSSRKKVSKRSS